MLEKINRLFVVLIIIRIISIFLSNAPFESINRIEEYGIQNHLNQILTVNPDELLIAEVAKNYIDGRGWITTKDFSISPLVNIPFKETAFRPTGPVYFHVLLMKVYSFFNGSIEIDSNHLYFKIYALLIIVANIIFFAISIFYFHSICTYLLSNNLISNYATIVYAIYPSVLLFVGNLVNYESIACSLVIISLSVLIKAQGEQKIKKISILILIFSILLTCLIRPQTILILLIAFLFFNLSALNLKNPLMIFKSMQFRLSLFVLIAVILIHIPILIKNYSIFSSYILSNQTGYSLYQGHNPYALGSWDGLLSQPTNPANQYLRRNVKDFDLLNEYEQSKAYQKVATDWIKSNPGKELILIIRKIAIFFLPYNSDHLKFNILNFLIHIGFLGFAIFIFLKKWKNKNYLLLISPIIGSVLVCEIYFVGYRWRYFAEPFMIVCAFLFFIYLLNIISPSILNRINNFKR